MLIIVFFAIFGRSKCLLHPQAEAPSEGAFRVQARRGFLPGAYIERLFIYITHMTHPSQETDNKNKNGYSMYRFSNENKWKIEINLNDNIIEIKRSI